jgi:hypothetical protein
MVVKKRTISSPVSGCLHIMSERATVVDVPKWQSYFSATETSSGTGRRSCRNDEQ